MPPPPNVVYLDSHSGTPQSSPSSRPAALGEEEDIEDYAPGGYLNVKVGDEFLSPSRQIPYTIVRKLGWGHFSTVWLIFNEHDKTYAALKVCASKYRETARDEISLLMKVRKRAFKEVATRHGRSETIVHPGARHIVSLLDYFSTPGRFKGEKHICMVLEPSGENLLSLLDKCRGRYHGKGDMQGVPLDIVKIIAKQVLMGLQFLHDECRLVHTDIKPENILVGLPRTQELIQSHLATSPTLPSKRIPVPDPDGRVGRLTVDVYRSQPISTLLSSIDLGGRSGSHSSSRSRSPRDFRSIFIQISDLGNATPVDRHYTEDIQTRQYRSPEAIIRRNDWGYAVDLWSVACMLFELATGDHLFDPRRKSGVYEKDDDHMAQIIELCGDFDLELKMGGKFSRDIFTSRGQLRKVHNLKPLPLTEVLAQNYKYQGKEAREFASFLTPMLRVDPELRATAGEMMSHEWLNENGHISSSRRAHGRHHDSPSYESYEWTN